MSLPPCFPTLNLAYFTSLNAQIEAAGAEMAQAEIQALVNEAYAQINMIEANITGQLAYLNPILALLTAPLNPTELLTWVATYIEAVLTPYVAPVVKYEAQLAAIAVEMSAIADIIEAIATARPEITIEIPAFPNITCGI